MYTVIKRMEISASHSLKLSYRSKCENLHGHNWIITVYCRSEVLNEDGMVVDFQTLELYAIQEHNAGYFIRDYYVEIESEEDGVEVKAFYCPKLNNGKKDGE